MSFTHKINENWEQGGRQIVAQNSYTGNSQGASIAETIPESSTDFEVTFSVDVSAIKLIYILASTDMVLETNDGGTPIDTINLKAGKPYIWHTDAYFTNTLQTDVTALFLTTGAVGDATLQIEVVTDPTP